MRAISLARHVLVATVSAALLSFPAALHSQATAEGKWIADFDLGMRNVDGVVSSTGTGKARVTLTLKGDSAFATWQTIEPAPPASTPPRALKGTYTNGVLKLETEASERRVRINDEDRVMRMLTRYEIRIEGDVMTGTVQPIDLGGQIEPPTRPFKAVREK
jgi:hypothetical protein